MVLTGRNIIELDNYQTFSKQYTPCVYGKCVHYSAYSFHVFMVYISFCRLSHYTEYMTDRDAVLLKAAVHISLVIMAFQNNILHERRPQFSESIF